MSFNRGMKRNSFGNSRPNFNRGSTGGSVGGAMGGNSVNRGVSPWESGVMPPGRGILPTPSNSLSLNSPQAQLVIASNLLSNLLRNQQDPSPQVPPLLSLGSNANGPGPNFRGQQSFSSQGRFNDRQIRGSNLKNQRPQPYNKMGNRGRDGVAGRRGPSAQQSRAQSQSGNQRSNGNQNQHRNDKNSKANAKNQTSKKQQQQDSKNSDKEKPNTETVVKSEKGEKDANKSEDKADKDGETTMETSESGEGDKTKSGDNSASPKKDDGGGKKSEARHADSRYAAVAMSQMHCHVCNKNMWDGSSFENHLRGRAHQLMMDKLDESYQMKVDLMRHELRVSEEQREMSLSNSKRRGKKVSVDLNVREYCTMCDLKFFGTLASHRKSDKHQQLKTFLHPRCHPCVKEFPSRIEYDEHCLTPTHMVAQAEIDAAKRPKKKLPKGENEIRTAEDEEKDTGTDPKAIDKDDEVPDTTDFIKDITEDVDLTKIKYPPYRYCRSKQIGLGASMVKEVSGFHCEKCRRFMLTQEDVTAHLKTLTHYRNFVNEVKALVAAAAPIKTDDAEAEGEGKEIVENEDAQSPAKRRKLNESSEDAAADGEAAVIEETTEENADKVKEAEDADKYDPMEAEAESEKEEAEAEGEAAAEAGAEAEGEGVKNDDAEKTDDRIEDVWGEIDEDESEMGNLIDADEKSESASESVAETPQKKEPQCTSTPAKELTKEPDTEATLATPATPVKAPGTPVKAPGAVSATPATPATPATAATPATPSTPSPPEPPIISKTPTSTPDTPNLNTSGNKNNNNTRGRGFRGNRGHQRARRSRR